MGLRNLLFVLVFGVAMASTPVQRVEASEETTAHEASDTHGAHQLNWFDFSQKGAPPLIALLINFACLCLIVYLMLRKPLSNRFSERKASFENEMKEASDLKLKAQAALETARQKTRDLDQEMDKLRREILDVGKAESARILEDAETLSERLRSDALAMVEQEVARLSQAIKKQVVEEIIAMAKAQIEQQLNSEDHDRFIATYITTVDDDRASMPPEP
ncbi:MAG: ATP synthase F0 subunit B [Myxococcota bacterium]|nr:ATP synthase F0 subunit B [Myxococcota bacterium]